jgi:hypothetical protein
VTAFAARGSTALVHWQRGRSMSETYAVSASISSLARRPDGTLWVGRLDEGPGLGLQRLRDGALEPFVTPQFDGSTIGVTSVLVDRDGNLWVASDIALIRNGAIETTVPLDPRILH